MNDSVTTLPLEHISVNALKVVKRLTEYGFEAYLVGGCVRDLILGRSPKDFDVATDAHPEEVRDIFRNSRSIGRRFQWVVMVSGLVSNWACTWPGAVDISATTTR